MIEELVKIGFTHEEASVYVAVLKLGRASISEIVDKSGVSKKRSYRALDRLLTDGFIIPEGNTKKVFSITDIDHIGEHLQQQSRVYKSLLPKLYTASNSFSSSKVVMTYTDPDVMRHLFKQQMKREPKRSTFLVIESPRFPFIQFMKNGQSGHDYEIYERNRVNRHIRLKIISLDDQISRLSEEASYSQKFRNYFEIVPLQASLVSNSLEGVYIWSDRVYLLDQSISGNYLLVEISNREIRQGFVAYFESLWNKRLEK